MASERVTVDKDERGHRVLLDGALLVAGFNAKFSVDLVAATLNAAFDKVEEGARAEAVQGCVEFVSAALGDEGMQKFLKRFGAGDAFEAAGATHDGRRAGG